MRRLDPAGAGEIAEVVEGAALLHAAAGDPDAFSELRILQLAEHLSSAMDITMTQDGTTVALEKQLTEGDDLLKGARSGG